MSSIPYKNSQEPEKWDRGTELQLEWGNQQRVGSVHLLLSNIHLRDSNSDRTEEQENRRRELPDDCIRRLSDLRVVLTPESRI